MEIYANNHIAPCYCGNERLIEKGQDIHCCHCGISHPKDVWNQYYPFTWPRKEV